MPDVLLTLHCADTDTDAIVDAIRGVSRAPIHVRAETVRGRDFTDARAPEQVTATLKRSSVVCVEDAQMVEAIIESAKSAKRRSPVRWHQTPVIASGRFE
jgi:hypothetical protein